MKAGIVVGEKTSIAKKRRYKHFPATKKADATMEGLLENTQQ
jgi:hypothetical protein